MKKIIVAILLFICAGFCFAGCGEDNSTYWLDTSEKLTTYFASEEYSALQNMTYSQNVTTIIAADYDTSYKQLIDVYKPLLDASEYTTKNYMTVLLMTPNSKNGLKNALINVEKNLEAYKKDVAEFLINKQNFENFATDTSQKYVDSSISAARLQNFKNEYLKLISSALTLSESMFNAYTIGYNNFSTLDELEDVEDTVLQANINQNIKLAVNSCNNQFTKLAHSILTFFNASKVADNYAQYYNTATTFYSTVAKDFTESSQTNTQALLDKLVIWKGVYDEFMQEVQVFDQITKQIDFEILVRFDNDIDKYVEYTGNQQDRSKLNYFFDYVNNLQVLNDYTVALI